MTSSINFLILFLCIITNFLKAQWLPTNGPDNGTVGGIYAADSVLFAATQDYVYSSSNKGTSWNQLKNGLLYNSIDCITGKGSYIFAGTNFSGLYRSSDFGNSWGAIRGIVTTMYISSFAWNNSALYVGGMEGVYKTTDFGINWIKVSSVNPEFRVISVFADDSLIIVGMKDAGVKMSIDSGKTWAITNDGLGKRSVQAYMKNDSVLYAGTDSGLFGMYNYDGKWFNADTSLLKVNIKQIVKIGKHIVAATSNGILRTDNFENPWKFTLYDYRTRNFLSICRMGSDLYAGTRSHGIYRSIDSGKIWRQTGAVTKKMTIETMVVRDSIVIAGSDNGVFLSPDEGSHWEDLSSDDVPETRAIAIQDSMFYAGSLDGVYRRTVNDKEWTLVSAQEFVECIKISGDSLYIGTHKGLYFSPDRGKTIFPLDTFFQNKAITKLGVFGQTLFVTSNVGIYYSTDHGKQWKPTVPSQDSYWVTDFAKNDSFYFAATGQGVYRMRLNDTVWNASPLGPVGTNDVAAICLMGKYIFLGMRGGGIIYSTNSGDNWLSGNTGNTQFMNVFAIGVNARKLFFGGAYSSIWSGPLSDLGIMSTQKDFLVLDQWELSQNYPNPFNPSTRIDYVLPTGSNVSLIVYDMLGREITRLVNGQKEAGRYSATWDASGNASGIYIARLTAGNYSSVRKLMLVK